jgi:sugar phosphate isomerase/epimerase
VRIGVITVVFQDLPFEEMLDHVVEIGCNDNKPYDQIAGRSWIFRSIGYGHDAKTWKDIMSALRMVGYDHVISIEHEDALMSFDEGLSKAIAMLKEACTFEPPSEMFWA